jgi:hypothetical protein
MPLLLLIGKRYFLVKKYYFSVLFICPSFVNTQLFALMTEDRNQSSPSKRDVTGRGFCEFGTLCLRYDGDFGMYQQW